MIKVGIMSDTPDSSGRYIFHPQLGGVIGTSPDGSAAPPYYREDDYPHKPHKWAMDGFHFEFDLAGTSIIKYSTNSIDARTGYTDNVHIVPESDGVTSETPAISFFTSATQAGTPILVSEPVVYGSDIGSNFLARPNYFLCFNSGPQTTLTNMSAEQAAVTGDPNTTGNPKVGGNPSITLNQGEIRCLYWHPDRVHKDVVVLGRISKTIDSNGYLFIRGWHHGNHINPDHIPPNIFVRESTYPTATDRWDLYQCHFEIGTQLTGTPPHNFLGSYQSQLFLELNTQSLASATRGGITCTKGLRYIDIHDPQILDSNGNPNASYITKMYDTGYGTSTGVTQVIQDPGSNETGFPPIPAFNTNVLRFTLCAPGETQCNIFADWYVVFNASPHTVNLQQNIRANNSQSVGSHNIECVRYKPKHKELVILGQISSKPDNNGFLSFKGIKPGTSSGSGPYDTYSGAISDLIGNTYTNAGLKIDTANNTATIANTSASTANSTANLVNSQANYHIDGGSIQFDPPTSSSTPYTSTARIVPGTGISTVNLNLNDGTTGAWNPVTNKTFIANASYYVVFNKSGIDFFGVTNANSSTPNRITTHEFGAIAENPYTLTNYSSNLLYIGRVSANLTSEGLLALETPHATISPPSAETVTRESMHPHHPTKWHAHGFHFEMEKPYAPYASYGGNISKLDIVAEGGATPAIQPNDESTAKNIGGNIVYVRQDYYLVFNGTSSTINTSNNFDVWSNTNTTFNPSGTSPAISSGSIFSLLHKPTHPGLYTLGRLSSGTDPAGYLYLRGWQHGVAQNSSSTIGNLSVMSNHINLTGSALPQAQFSFSASTSFTTYNTPGVSFVGPITWPSISTPYTAFVSISTDQSSDSLPAYKTLLFYPPGISGTAYLSFGGSGTIGFPFTYTNGLGNTKVVFHAIVPTGTNQADMWLSYATNTGVTISSITFQFYMFTYMP